MTSDEILILFERASGAPLPGDEPTRAIAERLRPVLAKAAGDNYLTPRESALLLIGLHALAAVRSSAVLPEFLALLRRPETSVEGAFGGDPGSVIPPLLLGQLGGDVAPLEALLFDEQVDGYVKWSLLETLAWLARTDRVPRERVVALLDRFDRDAPDDPSSLAWGGWQEALALLGLVEFEERARAGWADGRVPHHREVDRQDWIERLAAAHAHPDVPLPKPDQLVPVDDPECDLDWLADLASAPEPGADEALTQSEIVWLAGLLASRHWPETACNIDELDGLFTGLLVGPARPAFEDAVRELWTEEDEEIPPTWADAEQEAFAMGLLERRWRNLRADLEAQQPIEPITWLYDPGLEGRNWAGGFAMAMFGRRADWDRVFEDREAGEIARGILSLTSPETARTPRAQRQRSDLVDALPRLVQLLHAFWHAPDLFPRRAEPVRSAKVGRNDPCPCGSGRKHKKCCGLGGPGVAQLPAIPS